MSQFCTCSNFACPLHPRNHDKGCSPCISKNLKMKEIPTCFFNLVDPDGRRKGDSFEDFARAALQPPAESEV